MPVVLGTNQYGKAENRVVRVFRDADPHEIVDYNVSIALSGGQEPAYLTGDNAPVLPTDTMKNTAYAFAADDAVVAQPESYGLALARHFVDDVEPISWAQITLEMYPWSRLGQSPGHPHAFVRDGRYVRTAVVTYDGQRPWVVSGVRDLVVLKTTDSEFHGFLQDEFTTLAPTTDRIMATSMTAQWNHLDGEGGSEPTGYAGADWGKSYDAVLAALMDTYAGHHSLALQQTVFAMGQAVLEDQPSIGEIRFSAPNKHHFLYNLARFGRDNAGEVFHADDRPYGLMQATIRQSDAPDPGPAFG